jgi:hypothetical protein
MTITTDCATSFGFDEDGMAPACGRPPHVDYCARLPIGVT